MWFSFSIIGFDLCMHVQYKYIKKYIYKYLKNKKLGLSVDYIFLSN